MKLIRDPSTEHGTFGWLIVGDNRLVFLTLEPVVPIPTGEYKVELTVSGRAQRGELWTPDPEKRLLLLVDVPGYTGIRIHAGNTAKQTQGCILVGIKKDDTSLWYSRNALTTLMADYEPHITITQEVRNG